MVQSNSEGLRTGGTGDKSPGLLLEAQERSMQRSEGREPWLKQREQIQPSCSFSSISDLSGLDDTQSHP